MLQVAETSQLFFGQPAKYWKSYSFLPADSKNTLYTEHVKAKLVSYLQANTDYNTLSAKDQEEMISSAVRSIRTKLNAFPKAIAAMKAA